MAQNNRGKDFPFTSETIIGKGSLGSDPKVISGRGKATTVVLSVASNSRAFDKDGEPIEGTIWRDLKVFGFRADNVLDTLSKGDKVHYRGELSPKPPYVNRDGEEVFPFEVLVKEISKDLYESGDGNGRGSRSRGGDSGGSRSRGNSRSRNTEPEDDVDEGFDDGDFEDAPKSRSRSRSRGGDSGGSRSRSGGSRSRGNSRSRNTEPEDNVADDYSAEGDGVDDYMDDSLI